MLKLDVVTCRMGKSFNISPGALHNESQIATSRCRDLKSITSLVAGFFKNYSYASEHYYYRRPPGF